MNNRQNIYQRHNHHTLPKDSKKRTISRTRQDETVKDRNIVKHQPQFPHKEEHDPGVIRPSDDPILLRQDTIEAQFYWRSITQHSSIFNPGQSVDHTRQKAIKHHIDGHWSGLMVISKTGNVMSVDAKICNNWTRSKLFIDKRHYAPHYSGKYTNKATATTTHKYRQYTKHQYNYSQLSTLLTLLSISGTSRYWMAW